VKKIPAFYGTQSSITTFTRACHLSVFSSQINRVHAFPPNFLDLFHIILPSTPRSGRYPSGFPTKTLYAPLLFHLRPTCPVHLILLDLIAQVILGDEYTSLSSSLHSFLHSHVTSFLSGLNIFLSTIFSDNFSLYSSLNWETKFHIHVKQQAKL
jgi:hypothetical protein